MESKEFATQFMKLCFAFDKDYKEGQMLVYLEFIAPHKIEALCYAVQKAILGNQFFPKISELLDLMKEYRETIPAERQLTGVKDEPVKPETIAEFNALKVKLGLALDANRSERGCPADPEYKETEICDHCKMPIAIRNPSGFCDHLHYPENCDVCLEKKAGGK